MIRRLIILLLFVTSINASNGTRYIYFKDGTVKNYKETPEAQVIFK